MFLSFTSEKIMSQAQTKEGNLLARKISIQESLSCRCGCIQGLRRIWFLSYHLSFFSSVVSIPKRHNFLFLAKAIWADCSPRITFLQLYVKRKRKLSFFPELPHILGEERISIAIPRLLSFERPVYKAGSQMASWNWISGGFQVFLDTNGSLCPNYLCKQYSLC